MHNQERYAPLVRTLAALDKALAQRKWKDAVTLSNKILADPKASQLGNEVLSSCYLNRGFALRRLGSKIEALEDCRKASELNPANFKPHLNAALILAQDFEDYEEGLKEFNKALGLNPTSTEVLSSRGLAKMLLGDLSGAEADLRAALSIDPNHVDALCNLGNLYSKQGEFEQAAEVYKKALDIAPQDYEVRYNLALALRYMGSNHAAESVLRQDKKALQMWESRSGIQVQRGIPWHLVLFLIVAFIVVLLIVMLRFSS
jgi:tetratricopeptide (TPR) repeat protein